MPTKTEREYYRMGFRDGMRMEFKSNIDIETSPITGYQEPKRKVKRKLSAWNKYIKANAKKPRFRLRSGSPNLKKLAVAFRKTPAGKKKRR